MKSQCLLHRAPGEVTIGGFQIRRPTGSEVLVRNHFTGVSPGTEWRTLRESSSDQPYVPGYQAVGQVEDVGPDAVIAADSWVFHQGSCDCGKYKAQWGGHTALALVRENDLYVLPDGIDPPGVALAKLAAISLRGLRKACTQPGETVAVVGLGIIGQMSVRLSRCLGANVVGFDRLASRVEAAVASGIEARVIRDSLRATWDGLGREAPDVIIDATGNQQALNEAVLLARQPDPFDAPAREGTRYVLQGSFGGAFSLSYPDAFLRELTLHVPRDVRKEELREVIAMMGNASLCLDELAGDPVPFTRAHEIYGELATAGDRLTAVFDWRE